MTRNLFVTLSVAVMALTFAGCTGGESVEDQERFQLDRSAAEVTANQFRGMVEGMQSAMADEGLSSLQGALQSNLEELETINMDNLEGDAKATAEQMKSKITELAEKVNSGASEAEVREMLQELSDLAAKLPGGDGGAAAE